jgi:cell shape-determining protein MreC
MTDGEISEKDVSEMSEDELKEELKELYRKVNDLSKEKVENATFEGTMTLEKKNEDGEVVRTVEKEL